MYCSIPVALVLAWYAWDHSRIDVDFVAVKSGMAVDAVPATVTIEPALEIKVSSQVAGQITKGPVKLGQAVKTGDVLFEITPLNSPGQPVEVTATMDGIITAINAHPGELVEAYAPLARLWNGKAELIGRVNPENYVDIGVGMEAEVHLPGTGGESLVARVMQAPRFSETVGGDFRLVIALELPPERLLPGLVGNAQILRRQVPDSLLIPAAALNADGTVFLVNGKHAERVAIQTGSIFHGEVQVLAGLKPGDAVIIASAAPLHDGSRIQLKGN